MDGMLGGLIACVLVYFSWRVVLIVRWNWVSLVFDLCVSFVEGNAVVLAGLAAVEQLIFSILALDLGGGEELCEVLERWSVDAARYV